MFSGKEKKNIVTILIQNKSSIRQIWFTIIKVFEK